MLNDQRRGTSSILLRRLPSNVVASRARFSSLVGVARLAGVVAVDALVLAPSLHAVRPRPLPLGGAPKLTTGPLLGLVSGADPTSAVS
jgi:hypothetical protein